jgi:hypothetical protein
MHSLRGAWQETLYVYGDGFQRVHAQAGKRFLSVGLGLGYNEIMTAHLTQLAHSRMADESIEIHGHEIQGYEIHSYEAEPALRDLFAAWLCEDKTLPQNWRDLYDKIDRQGQALTGSPGPAREVLAQWFAKRQLQLLGRLDSQIEVQGRFDGIYFDAFSGKTSPDLWSEEFLHSFLARSACARCVFSTYASTGSLKRVLREHGFSLQPKAGFGTKREATIAVRSDHENGADFQNL